MANIKLLSDYERHYYGQTIRHIFAEFQPGERYYTHHFASCGSSVNGKDGRPLLRKILRTLASDGLIRNIDLGTNIHQWELVQKDNDTSDKQS